MTKVALKKAQKKDALYAAAFDLFTNEGTSDASISDIAKRAGVAKGTFYLYFKDKYDIKNRLVARKAGAIFAKAGEALADAHITVFEDQLIFLINHIIDQLDQNHALLHFISKNLSWGIFKHAITDDGGEIDENYSDVYDSLIAAAEKSHTDPQILLYMIVEFTSSTIYSSILSADPVPIGQLKPYLYRTIRLMVQAQRKDEA